MVRNRRAISEETREKIRKKLIWFKHTEESKKKMSIARKWLPSHRKWKTWIYSEETIKKMSISGKWRKFTEEHKRKISEKSKLHKHTLETIEKIRKNKIQLYKDWKGSTKEHMKKMADWNRWRAPRNKWLKNPFTKETLDKILESRKRYRHKQDTKDKIWDKRRWEKNNFWQGWVSYEPYTWEWTQKLRRKVRERDNYTCQMCLSNTSKRQFEVHHIDYDKTNSNENNLICLCKHCHTKTTNSHNRAYRKNYFYNIMNKKNVESIYIHSKP